MSATHKEEAAMASTTSSKQRRRPVGIQVAMRDLPDGDMNWAWIAEDFERTVYAQANREELRQMRAKVRGGLVDLRRRLRDAEKAAPKLLARIALAMRERSRV